MTTEHSLPRSGPEAQGIASSAVLAFVEAIEQAGLELHSLMLVRHGRVVAEGWWEPYGPRNPHMLYSLSKSFAATAAGLAAAEGRLSLDDFVLSFFPDDAPAEVGPNLAAMRVRHLLSMSTGHAEDTTGRLRDGDGSSWARAFLAQPVAHAPGTHFVYNSGATYMVSAIAQAVTGQTVLDFLRPRLFEPLGIADPTWESSPQGINVGGWGLNVTTEDIAKFGQLYLQRGAWDGKLLLPEAWVDEATAKHVSNGDDPHSDWAQGYGFQFWRCRYGAYRGDGAFGQFCVVLPEQDAVMAMTGGVGNLQAVLSLVWEHLLPAMQPAALPDAPAGQDVLARKLTGLTLRAPDGAPTSPQAAQVSGRTYRFEHDEDSNPSGVEAAVWDFHPNGTTLTVRDARGEHRVDCGFNTWRRGTTTLGEFASQVVAARAAWVSEDTAVLTVCFYETPFTLAVTGRFSGNRVSLEMRRNVSFGPTERPLLEGQAE